MIRSGTRLVPSGVATRGTSADDLITSDDHDVSTRAVCDVVGVAQPVLYRISKNPALTH